MDHQLEFEEEGGRDPVRPGEDGVLAKPSLRKKSLLAEGEVNKLLHALYCLTSIFMFLMSCSKICLHFKKLCNFLEQ